MKKITFLIAVLMIFTSLPLTVSAEEINTDNSFVITAKDEFITQGNVVVEPKEYKDNGKNVTALEMKEDSSVVWGFVPKYAGEYNLTLKYIPLSGSSNDIEAQLTVNGNGGSQNVTEAILKRVWINDGEIQKDAAGNQIRPHQKEAAVSAFYTHRGQLELYDNVYTLKEGVNMLSLTIVRESIALISIELTPVNNLVSYKEYLKLNRHKESGKSSEIIVEGEDVIYKSNSSLYAISDRSSPDTYPSHYSKTVLNSVGGANWSYVGQWIEWDVDVKETGFYNLTLRVRQNTAEGRNSCRRLYIDGKMPFAECNSISVPYNAGWQMFTAGNDEGDYKFYLEKGTHRIRLENTIGDLEEVIRLTDTLVSDLNSLYRRIMGYIGSSPDVDRDYKLDELMPTLKQDLEASEKQLNKAKKKLYEITKETGKGYAEFDDLERQVKEFRVRVSKIPRQFDQFETNIRALSEWLLTVQKQPLIIDRFILSTPDVEVEAKRMGFFERMLFGIRAFLATFTENYSSVISENTGKQNKTITVWLGASGRDQANALQSIVDSDFTPNTGIGVGLKLVDPNSLIPAVATGNGPDATLFVVAKTAMDYGFRGALKNLSDFSDYEEVIKVLYPESLVPFTYEGSTYALPDSYTFNMMFYRKDILEELSLKVPDTWDEVFTLLPELNNNFMTLGLPSLSVDNIEIYASMLWQNGGSPYNEKGTATRFATAEGIEAFEKLTDLYTKYGIPQTLDALTYFRTGQAPLVIAPFTFCNNLAAGAPEIEGLWGVTLIPGTKQKDGSINRTSIGQSTGSVIFDNSKYPNETWEFLKWWISEDAQYGYGIEIETTLGEAGRIATATTAALKRLPWDKEVSSVIENQLNFSKGFPEIPGGYMTTRYIPTALRLVVNNNLYPRDALITYSSLIDEEITLKRQEFDFE